MPSAHDKLPVTLYRMTLGGKVRIRKQVPGATSYDVVAEGPNEIVKPKHLDLKNYRGMKPLFQLDGSGGCRCFIDTVFPNSTEWSFHAAHERHAETID